MVGRVEDVCCSCGGAKAERVKPMADSRVALVIGACSQRYAVVIKRLDAGSSNYSEPSGDGVAGSCCSKISLGGG